MLLFKDIGDFTGWEVTRGLWKRELAKKEVAHSFSCCGDKMPKAVFRGVRIYGGRGVSLFERI